MKVLGTTLMTGLVLLAFAGCSSAPNDPSDSTNADLIAKGGINWRNIFFCPSVLPGVGSPVVPDAQLSAAEINLKAQFGCDSIRELQQPPLPAGQFDSSNRRFAHCTESAALESWTQSGHYPFARVVNHVWDDNLPNDGSRDASLHASNVCSDTVMKETDTSKSYLFYDLHFLKLTGHVGTLTAGNPPPVWGDTQCYGGACMSPW